MIKKLKQITAALALGLILALPASAVVSATDPDIQGQLNQGTCLSTDAGDCPQGDPTEQANSLVATVINIFSLVVGVISVIMIIFGGFRYITSGGASDKVTSAKNTIMYAIIGLVIVALAQFIVQFVLGKTTSL